MKSNYLKYIMILSVAIALGCTKNFDRINSNPDMSTEATAAWLATNMLTSITSSDISTTKSFCQPFMLAKYVLWTEKPEGFQYNKITRTSFGRLSLLRNVPIMNEYAKNEPEGVKNSYLALGHFIRAWQFFQLTMQVGDIPYSDAIKGDKGEIKPLYDTQKDVFLGILNELDSANYLFSVGQKFAGDFIYKGNPDQWRRLVNSFELHVLMQLYKKTSDNELKVVQRFNDIVTNRPLMRDFTDNFAVTYQNTAGLCYPWSNTPVQINSFIIYPVVGSALIKPLKDLQDRRLFYFTEPAPALIGDGMSPSNWNAYIGVDAAEENGVSKVARATGNFCDFNRRYVELFNAEPVGLFNYWDVQFVMAEAAVRGWLPAGSADQYYEAGIKGSMSFLDRYTPASYNHGMPLTESYIDSYLTSVKLSGSEDNKIKQIITQKYIAGFLQDVDYNAWYENRRTGYPEFTLNTSTNLNLPTNKFPKRWMYPQDELNYNTDNLETAVQRQYSGNDDVNELMWILRD